MMPIILPDAVWTPFSGKSTTPLQHDILCAHTEVGTNEGSMSIGAQPGHSYAHCYLDCLGVTWQCQDLAYRAAANLYGNPYVISWETEDIDSRCFSPWGTSCGNVPAWTKAQVQRLILDMAWCCLRFDIPPDLIPDTRAGRRGLAYHRQGVPGSPEWVVGSLAWTSAAGKCCPDWRRISQFRDLVVPGVQRIVLGIQPPTLQEDDMPTLYTSYDPNQPYLLSDGSGLSVLGDARSVINAANPNGAGAKEIKLAPDDYTRKVEAASIADEVAAVTMYASSINTQIAELKALSAEQLDELRELTPEEPVPVPPP